MNSENTGVRLIGVATMSKLIDDEGVEAVDGYRSLAAYVHDRSPWTPEKRAVWAGLTKREGRVAENHPRVGVGSLRKRAPDVQSALSVVGAGKKAAPGLRVDFRDVDLQGAALGHARLPGALFSGAHLDYLDTRTGEGPYATFAGAEFREARLEGTSFKGANLSAVNFDLADLKGAIYDAGTIWPVGFYAPPDRGVIE